MALSVSGYRSVSGYDYDQMDEIGFEEMLKYELEDLRDLLEKDKGKGHEDEPNDAVEALTAQMGVVEASLQSHRDFEISQSIARAIYMDRNIIAEEVEAERVAVADREMASRLANGADQIRPTQHAEEQADTELDDEMLAKLTALYVSEDHGRQLLIDTTQVDTIAESSADAVHRQSKDVKLYRQCVACESEFEFFQVCRFPCDHEYCSQCVDELFRLALADETLFPPRCCRKEVSIDSARFAMSKETASEYVAKLPELLSTDRTYCHIIECQDFIGPESIDSDVGTCRRCAAETCTMCKAAAHTDDCPKDEALQELVILAKDNGWQRCSSCHRIVDLAFGCYHITCRCGTQFCYLCGETWKTCACPQFHEDRLLSRAEVIVNLGPHRHRGEAERQREIERVAEDLRHNHDCNHDNWIFRYGPNRCEECHDRLPSFIMQCGQCHLRACRRCTRNRL